VTKNNPLVTVIIPSYNHEKYVVKAIESVLTQTYKNIELIVIDDGSKDHSVKKILELKARYSFKFIARKNKGLANTLNQAIKLAKGLYITALASDDYYLPKRIEHAVNHLNLLPKEVVAVYTDGYIVAADERKICLFSNAHPRPLIGSTYNNLLHANWIPAMGVSYRANVLKKIMYDKRFIIEDWTLHLRVFKNKYNKIYFYNELDFCYRRHQNNISKEGDLMKAQLKLMQSSFKDFGDFMQIKDDIKIKSSRALRKLSFKAINLLFLASLRVCQHKFIKYKVSK
jgi:glycosyltransferase involved in cell wall biosynthesis